MFGGGGAGREGRGDPLRPRSLKGRFVRGGAVGEGRSALPPQPLPRRGENPHSPPPGPAGEENDWNSADNKGGRGAASPPPHPPPFSPLLTPLEREGTPTHTQSTRSRFPANRRQLRAGERRGELGKGEPGNGGGSQTARGGAAGSLETAACLLADERQRGWPMGRRGGAVGPPGGARGTMRV